MAAKGGPWGLAFGLFFWRHGEKFRILIRSSFPSGIRRMSQHYGMGQPFLCWGDGGRESRSERHRQRLKWRIGNRLRQSQETPQICRVNTQCTTKNIIEVPNVLSAHRHKNKAINLTGFPISLLFYIDIAYGGASNNKKRLRFLKNISKVLAESSHSHMCLYCGN